jgi:hypothetical protein
MIVTVVTSGGTSNTVSVARFKFAALVRPLKRAKDDGLDTRPEAAEPVVRPCRESECGTSGLRRPRYFIKDP